ncbi:uncharacterized protein [Coffea arabica]|uniref:Protein root UVB sensitive 6 N-terminal domain-containing protein n=1 Tax=Coffea arabica TaxID=13443 RepID=A0ABM4VG52_COFAR|nr:uncharacterized protein LOC113706496 [Coffea arabica]
MKLKHPSNSTSKTLSAMTSSQDARVLVRETLRISANLASAPRPALPPPPISAAADGNVATFGLVEEQFLNSSLRLICREEIDGRRWEYFADLDNSKQFRKKSIRAVSLHSRQAPGQKCLAYQLMLLKIVMKWVSIHIQRQHIGKQIQIVAIGLASHATTSVVV